jgi:hypothetical protein
MFTTYEARLIRKVIMTVIEYNVLGNSNHHFEAGD